MFPEWLGHDTAPVMEGACEVVKQRMISFYTPEFKKQE